ncbi:hypothetical protein JHK87_024351 [Glycine soja]|uniref:Uncharacterized protein n=1 Tax=Glycine max TaxID=3847 RepID=K7LCH9_SOYBN|nr:hypothetical protein JHK87_024351 [Glycine soja]
MITGEKIVVQGRRLSFRGDLRVSTSLYDDRFIRVHVRHTKELLSLSNPNASLSTSLSRQNDKEQDKA